MQIGSGPWRIKNYGFIPYLKYLFFAKLFKRKFYIKNFNICTSITELNEYTLKIEQQSLDHFIINFNKFYERLILNLNLLNEKRIGVKSSNLHLSATKTRLLVLCFFAKFRGFDIIVETGTQNGISALTLENFCDENLTDIFSLDVKQNAIPKGRGMIKFIILESPVRKSLKQHLNTIVSGTGDVLFFHDSDHSYENMYFEFNYAWKFPQVTFLVSDDVSENLAFTRFTRKNNLSPIFCKFDSGQVVGLVTKSGKF
jgi:hypothetical protein